MNDRKVFLIRHTEPLLPDNKKKFIGQTDVLLSHDGIEHAYRLGETLRQENVKSIYTSPLRRAFQTAKIIGDLHGLTPIIIPELTEIYLGNWEDRSFEEIQKDFPEEFEERGKNLVGYRVPGGESFEDLYRRGRKMLQGILSSSEGNLIMVGHKGMNRELLCAILKIPLQQLMSIPQNYGCINILGERNRTLEVLKINTDKACP